MAVELRELVAQNGLLMQLIKNTKNIVDEVNLKSITKELQDSSSTYEFLSKDSKIDDEYIEELKNDLASVAQNLIKKINNNLENGIILNPSTGAIDVEASLKKVRENNLKVPDRLAQQMRREEIEFYKNKEIFSSLFNNASEATINRKVWKELVKFSHMSYSEKNEHIKNSEMELYKEYLNKIWLNTKEEINDVKFLHLRYKCENDPNSNEADRLKLEEFLKNNPQYVKRMNEKDSSERDKEKYLEFRYNFMNKKIMDHIAGLRDFHSLSDENKKVELRWIVAGLSSLDEKINILAIKKLAAIDKNFLKDQSVNFEYILETYNRLSGENKTDVNNIVTEDMLLEIVGIHIDKLVEKEEKGELKTEFINEEEKFEYARKECIEKDYYGDRSLNRDVLPKDWDKRKVSFEYQTRKLTFNNSIAKAYKKYALDSWINSNEDALEMKFIQLKYNEKDKSNKNAKKELADFLKKHPEYNKKRCTSKDFEKYNEYCTNLLEAKNIDYFKEDAMGKTAFDELSAEKKTEFIRRTIIGLQNKTKEIQDLAVRRLLLIDSDLVKQEDGKTIINGKRLLDIYNKNTEEKGVNNLDELKQVSRSIETEKVVTNTLNFLQRNVEKGTLVTIDIEDPYKAKDEIQRIRLGKSLGELNFDLKDEREVNLSSEWNLTGNPNIEKIIEKLDYNEKIENAYNEYALNSWLNTEQDVREMAYLHIAINKEGHTEKWQKEKMAEFLKTYPEYKNREVAPSDIKRYEKYHSNLTKARMLDYYEKDAKKEELNLSDEKEKAIYLRRTIIGLTSDVVEIRDLAMKRLLMVDPTIIERRDGRSILDKAKIVNIYNSVDKKHKLKDIKELKELSLKTEGEKIVTRTLGTLQKQIRDGEFNVIEDMSDEKKTVEEIERRRMSENKRVFSFDLTKAITDDEMVDFVKNQEEIEVSELSEKPNENEEFEKDTELYVEKIDVNQENTEDKSFLGKMRTFFENIRKRFNKQKTLPSGQDEKTTSDILEKEDIENTENSFNDKYKVTVDYNKIQMNSSGNGSIVRKTEKSDDAIEYQ